MSVLAHYSTNLNHSI